MNPGVVRALMAGPDEMAALTPETEFLTVDIVIRSRTSLAPLRAVWPLTQTKGKRETRTIRWLLVTLPTSPTTIEQGLKQAVRLVERLPPAARRCWNAATTRTFDIGIQCGMSRYIPQNLVVREKTLRLVTRVGGQLLVTVYPPHEELH